ncbi:hypothetical protein TPAU25S_01417 [Tsukamurella paurometabola]|uniref:IrrE N-terminal-like domain-containing protein n=1 Tax=Tsukamurella paurometabola (strain ATCC 8368 / DSM 20162 / CCUG 35730 / CIP 100753 / JCM 10117 / KCTC 9821 / NBRC 16120 / NCIMB 702349 / NCTC 13040) TaxID=521096 RepID=D5UV99_TSUPD|nr:hypothetical protein [Tsukamurella paurometabola]ADG77689.1 conserved hypothetical protein [Tsukamurella paurometabola DSM 20162]SUP28316.1 Uncharacterised protein [Tsukamurella paurometabola]
MARGRGRRGAPGCSPKDVDAALNGLLAVSSAEEARTLTGLVAAAARMRGRPLSIEFDDDLPAGVFGWWLAKAGDDVIMVPSGLPSQGHTIAHELGHVLLGHRGGTELTELLGPGRPSAEVVEFMLCRESDQGAVAEEAAAEMFARRLLSRVRQTQRVADPRSAILLSDFLR